MILFLTGKRAQPKKNTKLSLRYYLSRFFITLNQPVQILLKFKTLNLAKRLARD
jgi:hypothetical protein